MTRTNFLEFLTARLPELAGFDKENQKEISAAIKQFGLKDIIKYFHKLVKQSKKNLNANIITEMIPEYSRFSTFTHGGMYANTLMDKYSNENNITNEIVRIIEISLISICVIREGSLLFYKSDKEVKDAILKLQKNRM